jgi:hypothetical protein
MKARLLPVMFAVIALTAAAFAQNSGSAPPPGQNSGQGNGGGSGQRGGRGGMDGGMGMMRRVQIGTVTEVAADHYIIKTDFGEVYTVRFTADTRITKQAAGARGPGGGGQGMGGGRVGRGGYGGGGGNPPQEIKATDIKVGDVVSVGGEIDDTAKTVNARVVSLMDPQVVEQIRQMEANFGKTWLNGKVTAINGTTITLTGTLDNAPHTVVADENTTFRRRRDPITLADIQVGDTVSVEGAVNNGVFIATAISVGGMTGGPSPNGPSGPPSGAPPALPPGAPPQ